jgi:hypothetical protein
MIMKAKAGLLPTLFVVAVGFAPLPLSTVTTAVSHDRSDDDEKDEKQNERRSCGRVFAINAANELLTLDAEANPSCQSPPREHRRGRVGIESRMQIVGLAPAEQLVGIDFRPATGQLYGLGNVTQLGQLYTIDPETAIATIVGFRDKPLLGTRFGFDFNPAFDQIRLTSNTIQNVLINPDSGVVVRSDGPLRYGPFDPNTGRQPSVVTAVAHTNPDNDPLSNTVLYDIDVARANDPLPGGGDVLAVQIPPPNAGQLNTVGRLLVDVEEVNGFDIGPGNGALAAMQLRGKMASDLFSIDLLSGRATHLGRIGGRRHNQNGELITGLAIDVGTECGGEEEEDDDDR